MNSKRAAPVIAGGWIIMVLLLFVSLGINVFLALHVTYITANIETLADEAAIDSKKYVAITEFDEIRSETDTSMADINISLDKLNRITAGLVANATTPNASASPEIICLTKKVCGVKLGLKWFIVSDVVDINAITPSKFKLGTK